LKQQELLAKRLEEEQKTHGVLHDGMSVAEQALLKYAKKKKIVVQPTRIERRAAGLLSETTKPARYISGPADAEFGRLLAEYLQKFESHDGNNKRLTLLEDQIIKERKESSKVLKSARGITENEAKAGLEKARAHASKEKFEAEKAKIEVRKLRRDQPGAFERLRQARTRRDLQAAEAAVAQKQAIEARRELRQIKEQEKQEKRLRKEQAHLDHQRAKQVRVAEHQRKLRIRAKKQKRKKPQRKSGWF